MSAPIAESAELHHLGMRAGRLLPHEVWRLRRLLRAGRYDVIQSWMYHANLMAAMAGWGDGVPVVWNIRHSLHALAHEKRSTRWVIRAGAGLSRRPARIIFNAAASRAQHVAFGYDGPRSVVIPGSYAKKFAAGEYNVPCALIIGQRKESTDLKTSLNNALREYDVAV